MEQYMQETVKALELYYPQILISLLIFSVTLLTRGFIVRVILWLTNRMLVGLSEETRSTVRSAFEKPLRVLVIFCGLYAAIVNLQFELQTDSLLSRMLKVILIITIAYGFYYMDQIITLGLSRFRKKIQFEASEILKKFLLRMYHAVVIIVAITMVADQFGINVNSIIAGFGIAGLAVALAAQETIANIFGGVTVIFDKPFDVGDLILTGNVEGVVEDINFRTTRIRTLSKEYVTIPNSKIANGAITNYTKRDLRRVKMKLGATYSTPKIKIQKVIEEIEAFLLADTAIDTESVIVRFDGFGPSSKDIYISFITLTGDWSEYLTIKQEACYGMMDVFEKHGVEFAFPSQSIYFENELLTKPEGGKMI